MNLQELRLGNFVCYELGSDTSHTIIAIHPTAVDTGYRKLLSYYQVFPIPLTEEWIARFGFILIEESNHKFHKLNVARLDNVYALPGDDFGEFGRERVLIVLDPSTLDIRCFQLNGVLIEYVHQLQNLYFALTGDELKLN